MDFDQLLEQGFVAHRIYVVDDPDVHVLGALLEETDSAGVIFARGSHDEDLVGVFTSETAGYGLKLVESYAAGFTALAGDEGWNGVTHKDDVNLVDRVNAHRGFVTYGNGIFLAAVPVYHGADYGVGKSAVVSCGNVINMKLKYISGFCYNVAYHFIFEPEGYAAFCYVKISDNTDLHKAVEEHNCLAEAGLRKNIVAKLVRRTVLNRLFYRRNVFIPSVSEGSLEMFQIARMS